MQKTGVDRGASAQQGLGFRGKSLQQKINDIKEQLITEHKVLFGKVCQLVSTASFNKHDNRFKSDIRRAKDELANAFPKSVFRPHIKTAIDQALEDVRQSQRPEGSTRTSVGYSGAGRLPSAGLAVAFFFQQLVGAFAQGQPENVNIECFTDQNGTLTRFPAYPCDDIGLYGCEGEALTKVTRLGASLCELQPSQVFNRTDGSGQYVLPGFDFNETCAAIAEAVGGPIDGVRGLINATLDACPSDSAMRGHCAELIQDFAQQCRFSTNGTSPVNGTVGESATADPNQFWQLVYPVLGLFFLSPLLKPVVHESFDWLFRKCKETYANNSQEYVSLQEKLNEFKEDLSELYDCHNRKLVGGADGANDSRIQELERCLTTRTQEIRTLYEGGKLRVQKNTSKWPSILSTNVPQMGALAIYWFLNPHARPTEDPALDTMLCGVGLNAAMSLAAALTERGFQSPCCCRRVRWLSSGPKYVNPVRPAAPSSVPGDVLASALDGLRDSPQYWAEQVRDRVSLQQAQQNVVLRRDNWTMGDDSEGPLSNAVHFRSMIFVEFFKGAVPLAAMCALLELFQEQTSPYIFWCALLMAAPVILSPQCSRGRDVSERSAADDVVEALVQANKDDHDSRRNAMSVAHDVCLDVAVA